MDGHGEVGVTWRRSAAPAGATVAPDGAGTIHCPINRRPRELQPGGGGDPGRVGSRRGLGVASRVHVPVSSHLTPSTLSLLPLSDRRMPPSRRNLHLRATPARQQPENLLPFPCLGIPSDGPLPRPDPDSPHHLAQKGSPPPQGSRQTRLLCPSSERWLSRHHVLQR